MELASILVVVLIMASMTALYFVIGYRFLKKHRRGKDGNN